MPSNQLSFKRYGRFYRDARKYATRREVLISSYLILSLFTVTFFAAVFIRPTAVKIATLWREIQDKQSVHEQLENKIRDLEEAQELYASIEEDLYLIDRALPSHPEFDRFLQKIEYLSFSHGLRLSTGQYTAGDLYSSQSSSPSADSLMEFPFSLVIEGSYAQLVSFLGDLKNLDRLVGFTTISIHPIEDLQSGNVFQLTLSINSSTYSFPETVSEE